jgi:ABC-type polysaccharide/polyol phosphate transport system ATPase subunit
MIEVQKVTFRVPVVQGRARSLLANPLSILADFYRPYLKREVRTILSDITFELRDGDRLALIGRNGAGKTTLLRVLAGILMPTGGSVTVRGTVQSMLNVTLGFHSDATGLENIYLRGLSMGLSLNEIRHRVPDIVEFSELGDRIHDPLRTYSAGMRLKLGFSVVTSTRPNVLLMDEWLSAGDSHFIERARTRLWEQIDTSRVAVLASHSQSILRRVCNRGLVLDGGNACFFGPLEDALKFYDGIVRSPDASAQDKQTKRQNVKKQNARPDKIPTQVAAERTKSAVPTIKREIADSS